MDVSPACYAQLGRAQKHWNGFSVPSVFCADPSIVVPGFSTTLVFFRGDLPGPVAVAPTTIGMPALGLVEAPNANAVEPVGVIPMGAWLLGLPRLRLARLKVFPMSRTGPIFVIVSVSDCLSL